MRYFGRVLFFVSGGLFLRVIPLALNAADGETGPVRVASRKIRRRSPLTRGY